MKQTHLGKRILTSFLALTLAASSLCASSCAKSGDGTDTESTDKSSVNSSETAAESETTAAYDTVKKQKFHRDFALLDSISCEGDEGFHVDSMNGELLNDALYERNTAIENDFDIQIKSTEKESFEVESMLTRQVKANLDEYDAFTSGYQGLYRLGEGNQLYNLSTVDTMHIDREWWDPAFQNNLSVGGKSYMATGDHNIFSMTLTACLTFNKKMLTDLNRSVDALNETVNNGKWTLDEMLGMTADITRDLNGDGVLDEKDQYGISVWQYDVPYSLFYGAGCRFINFDEDRMPELAYNADKVVDVYDSMYRLLIEQKSYFVTDIAKYQTNYQVFNEGRALFCDLMLNKITSFLVGEAKDPYGIIPMPKYDTNQEEYLSFVQGAASTTAIAKSEKTPEFSGTILEALATYSHDRIIPLMFEVVTKLQTAQDPQSAAMVDYIIRNRVYDFAYTASYPLGTLVQSELTRKSQSIASRIQSAASSAEKLLRKSLVRLKKCD